MSSAVAPVLSNEQRTERAEGGLDVDWLLQSKKDIGSQSTKRARPTPPNQLLPDGNKHVDPEHSFPSQTSTRQAPFTEDNVAPDAASPATPRSINSGFQQSPVNNSRTSQPSTPVATSGTPSISQRPSPQTENKHHRPGLGGAGAGGAKDKRRSSWFSSIGSKLSGSSKDSSGAKSPKASPALEKGNPFDNTKTAKDAKKEDMPVVVTHTRRPSVLVAAGTETKLDPQPGFLSSALRRLSSGNTATLGRAAGSSNSTAPRKLMNIDQNRERTRIQEFDQNKLRRVAFKVDVEVAGVSAAADEQNDAAGEANATQADDSKDSKMAKYKDKSEGAALKKAQSLPENDQNPKPTGEAQARREEEKTKMIVEQHVAAEEAEARLNEGASAATSDVGQPTTTRKKEKKKRSEAERKERKERKKRHAEANGLVPLEITMDDSSDSSPSNTPPGASTPRKGQPTTDPLRIYKRCCQLRESSALSFVKDQISKPSATLAEAPGTVASVDLSGNQMSLQDIATVGDWLAIVPVRRLILDNCNLSDEGLRIILSGLMSCKSQEQARHNRKLPSRLSGQRGLEQMGVIEKLSLKNNSSITSLGWKHIALFLHMCRSLRGIDLTGIPFPAGSTDNLSRTSTASMSMTGSGELPPRHLDLGTLFTRALADRFGDRLEELIVSNCALESPMVSAIVDSAVKCKIKRLGLANNNFDVDATSHVVRYVTSGICEGLDMGGNDLNGHGHLLTEVLDEQNPLVAMSLAGCNMSVEDLSMVMQHLSRLQNFKFIDFSKNYDLFTEEKDCLSVLRKYLPRMRDLKRIHLSDVNMNTSQLISISEILPDCPVLAHISVLENQKLVDCMNSTSPQDQEEACAVFVSLMTAVRASKTLVAVEIEVPGHESSEVVKALSSQVVAYSLRNLERSTLGEFGVQSDTMPEKLDRQPPEVLLHLVGHMEGYTQNHDNDEPAPDDDYVIASTGIVRALNTCLTNKELASHNITPSASGTATPTRVGATTVLQSRPQNTRKPRDVSLELCESARKIRQRLRPAMIKEDQAGNSLNYRRLQALDQTLERTIKRFEDEYPESIAVSSPPLEHITSNTSSLVNSSGGNPLSTSVESTDLLDRINSGSVEDASYSTHPYGSDHESKLDRTESTASLAARRQIEEEGRMHRFGQTFRRELLKPVGTDDALHGTSVYDAPEPQHLSALRARLEGLGGDTIRHEVNEKGADAVIRELGITAEELREMAREDPEDFEALKHSQLANELNTNNTNYLGGMNEMVRQGSQPVQNQQYQQSQQYQHSQPISSFTSGVYDSDGNSYQTQTQPQQPYQQTQTIQQQQQQPISYIDQVTRQQQQ